MSEIERLHLARRALLARLPDAGSAGATRIRRPGAPLELDHPRITLEDRDRLRDVAVASPTGSALFLRDVDATLVLPPFPFERSDDFSEIHTAPLIELLERKRAIGVLLLRLGGFSVGFFRGDALIDSKTDQRFVKNRHRKGGQSQRRFDRMRDKQVFELFGKTCETAREKLEPYEAEVQHVFFGGDRHTLQAFRKQCTYFERFGERVMARVLPVAGDPRRASLEGMPHEIWSSEVYVVRVELPA